MTTYSHLLAQPTLDGAIAELEAALRGAPGLAAIGQVQAGAPTAPGKWSRKEILGHLIDSALNNLQRFIRAQVPAHRTEGVLRLPSYAQDDWVRVSAHQARDWGELVELWATLNRHVLHVLRHLDRALLGTSCVIGDSAGAPLRLELLAVDYVGHLKHHLRQMA